MANGTNRAKFGARAISGSAGKSKVNKKPFEKTQQVQKDLTAGEIHKARVGKYGSNRAVSGSGAIRGSRGKGEGSTGAYGYEYTKQQKGWKGKSTPFGLVHHLLTKGSNKADPNPFGKDAHGTASKKTYKGDVSYSDVKKNKNKKGADYRASHGVGDETALGLKPPSAFETAKTATKKKRKKNTKRAARKRFREAVVEKNKTPGRTKKTAKKIGKGIGKLVGKVADKLPGGEKRKKKKKQKVAHDKKVKAMGGIPKIQM